MKNKYVGPIVFAVFINFLCFSSCGSEKQRTEKPVSVKEKVVAVPDFNADSAYAFVSMQVQFGPRVPNTPPHISCEEYLQHKLTDYNASVYVQKFQAEAFNSRMLNLSNIIGSLFPERNKRILLAAHWDTRPFADKDTVRTNEPIDGANDGASGVAVLLEIARVMSLNPSVKTGVDIIFFDGEDYGEPADYKDKAPDQAGKIWWCLGSQYWVKNKHPKNYIAYYGVLLDMVGAQNAQFYQEGGSMQFAPKIVNKIWSAAEQAGYGDYFITRISPGITDDHIFINRDAGIPAIDIVEYKPGNHNSFFGEYHHTHQDNMQIIDKNTLKAVGQTLLYVLYHE